MPSASTIDQPQWKRDRIPRAAARLTRAGRQLHVEQVFEAAVLPCGAVVGDGTGAEEQAALFLAPRVVGDHGVHVKVAALGHVGADLDGDPQAVALLLIKQLDLMVGPLEGLPLLVGACGTQTQHSRRFTCRRVGELGGNPRKASLSSLSSASCSVYVAPLPSAYL